MPVQAADTSAKLRPYIPRLTISWLNGAPDQRVLGARGHRRVRRYLWFHEDVRAPGRRGKVGAEEVTDNLGSVFTRMLSVAYAEDGSLLKFGGDALLLFFEGDDHVIRGVRSAHGMRAAPSRGRQAEHLRREGHPSDVGRRAQRPLSLLPRRRFASRTPRDRPGREPSGRDGGNRDGGRDLCSARRPPPRCRRTWSGTRRDLASCSGAPPAGSTIRRGSRRRRMTRRRCRGHPPRRPRTRARWGGRSRTSPRDRRVHPLRWVDRSSRRTASGRPLRRSRNSWRASSERSTPTV